MNRFLLSIPVLFAASITAAACSSSSSPNGGTGVDGGGGTPNPDCATLAACCTTFTGTQATQCTQVVAAGGTACTTNLQAAQKAGACEGTTGGKDGGTGIPDTGVTHPNDTGMTHPVDTGTPNPDTGTPAGCNPQPVTGMTFAGKTLFGSVCTASQVDVFVTDCFGASDTDAEIGDCNTAITGADGGLNDCGSCGLSDPNGASWGAFINLIVPVSVGATTGTEIPLFNQAGCVGAVDPSSTGQACAAALEEQQECEFAACVAVCPVASETDTAGQDALLGTSSSMGCLGNADSSVCMTQAMAAATACASETNAGMTGALDKCTALLNAANVMTPTAASTTAFEQFVGLMCGGVDAGL